MGGASIYLRCTAWSFAPIHQQRARYPGLGPKDRNTIGLLHQFYPGPRNINFLKAQIAQIAAHQPRFGIDVAKPFIYAHSNHVENAFWVKVDLSSSEFPRLRALLIDRLGNTLTYRGNGIRGSKSSEGHGLTIPLREKEYISPKGTIRNAKARLTMGQVATQEQAQLILRDLTHIKLETLGPLIADGLCIHIDNTRHLPAEQWDYPFLGTK